ncbi:hypothetical protein [Nevskia sp.]|uniref:hypothetical protein n=1 Tax=Nevskia sp. TaxID=1929292 RepID=UPI0025F441CC|nr:hypothetical protein [Nevskia sp.]
MDDAESKNGGQRQHPGTATGFATAAIAVGMGRHHGQAPERRSMEFFIRINEKPELPDDDSTLDRA